MKNTFIVPAFILFSMACLFPIACKAEEPDSELIDKLRQAPQAKFDKLPEVQVNPVEKAGDLFILQTQTHQKLKPSSGYIIWFEIQEGGDSKLTFSLNILGNDTIGAYPKLFPMMQR